VPGHHAATHRANFDFALSRNDQDIALVIAGEITGIFFKENNQSPSIPRQTAAALMNF
jgi:hypothetical protein